MLGLLALACLFEGRLLELTLKSAVIGQKRLTRFFLILQESNLKFANQLRRDRSMVFFNFHIDVLRIYRSPITIGD